jgi:hypothetical protein
MEHEISKEAESWKPPVGSLAAVTRLASDWDKGHTLQQDAADYDRNVDNPAYDEIPNSIPQGEVVYTINPSAVADRKLMGLKFALKANSSWVVGIDLRESKVTSYTELLSDNWNLLTRIKNLLNKPVKADVKQAPPSMEEETVNFHLKCLAGRILTLVDAMVSGDAQNKAFKTYVKKEFREQFSRVCSFFHGDSRCAEANDPAELAVAEKEF